jgi:hypothetical protein
MAGRVSSAGIYALDGKGKQVYVHAMWKMLSATQGRLSVYYVGCGRPGRSQQVDQRDNNPLHRAWLERHWVPRTLLFAQPRRLEHLDWLEEVLAEYGCTEGLVIFETPFLANAERVEQRLIEIYKVQAMGTFNSRSGKLPSKQFKPKPNQGVLRPHVQSIRARHAAGEAIYKIARDHGVDPASIRSLIKGRSYKDVA